MIRSKKVEQKASHKKGRKTVRSLRVEGLEARVLLACDVAAKVPTFGFTPVSGGFAFEISGTDWQQSADGDCVNARADSIYIWTNPNTLDTNFAIEYQNGGGTWETQVGSVSSGEIADYAASNNWFPDQFQGFFVKMKAGNDVLYANGGGIYGQVGTYPNRPAVGPFGNNPMPLDKGLIGQELIVDGNEGNDTVYGSAGSDVISGGPGADSIYGFGGDDVISGDGDNDVLAGGDGNDTVKGGGGDDQVLGNAGNDNLNGEDGNDYVEGGAGNDTVQGGAGNDDLVGDSKTDGSVKGTDFFDGGDGDDSLLIDNRDKPLNGVWGGNGTDAAQAGPSTDGGFGTTDAHFINNDLEKIDFTGRGSNMEPTLADGKRFDRAGPFDPATWTNTTFTSPEGFAYNDFLNSANVNVQVDNKNTYPYNGTYQNGAAIGESIDGGIYITGGGNDLNIGGAKSDILDTGSGNDTLTGGAGNDYLLAGNGQDLLDGGPGADFIDGDGSKVANQSGTTGTDTLTYAGSDAGVRVDLDPKNGKDANGNAIETNDDPPIAAVQGSSQPVNGAPSNLGGGWAQGDIILKESPHNSTIECLIGSGFDDYLRLDGKDNGGIGIGGGAVCAEGGTGNDEIHGNANDNVLKGGDGNDTIYGYGGNDDIYGQKGDDTLLGGDGNDTLSGGDGADDLDGGAGTDAQTGGKGSDKIRTEYESTTDMFNDTNLVDLRVNGFIGFLFGNEQNDEFIVKGTGGNTTKQMDVMSELAVAETFGSADFENNEDDLTFVD